MARSTDPLSLLRTQISLLPSFTDLPHLNAPLTAVKSDTIIISQGPDTEPQEFAAFTFRFGENISKDQPLKVLTDVPDGLESLNTQNKKTKRNTFGLFRNESIKTDVSGETMYDAEVRQRGEEVTIHIEEGLCGRSDEGHKDGDSVKTIVLVIPLNSTAQIAKVTGTLVEKIVRFIDTGSVELPRMEDRSRPTTAGSGVLLHRRRSPLAHFRNLSPGNRDTILSTDSDDEGIVVPARMASFSKSRPSSRGTTHDFPNPFGQLPPIPSSPSLHGFRDSAYLSSSTRHDSFSRSPPQSPNGTEAQDSFEKRMEMWGGYLAPASEGRLGASTESLLDPGIIRAFPTEPEEKSKQSTTVDEEGDGMQGLGVPQRPRLNRRISAESRIKVQNEKKLFIYLTTNALDQKLRGQTGSIRIAKLNTAKSEEWGLRSASPTTPSDSYHKRNASIAKAWPKRSSSFANLMTMAVPPEIPSPTEQSPMQNRPPPRTANNAIVEENPDESAFPSNVNVRLVSLKTSVGRPRGAIQIQNELRRTIREWFEDVADDEGRRRYRELDVEGGELSLEDEALHIKEEIWGDVLGGACNTETASAGTVDMIVAVARGRDVEREDRIFEERVINRVESLGDRYREMTGRRSCSLALSYILSNHSSQYGSVPGSSTALPPSSPLPALEKFLIHNPTTRFLLLELSPAQLPILSDLQSLLSPPPTLSTGPAYPPLVHILPLTRTSSHRPLTVATFPPFFAQLTTALNAREKSSGFIPPSAPSPVPPPPTRPIPALPTLKSDPLSPDMQPPGTPAGFTEPTMSPRSPIGGQFLSLDDDDSSSGNEDSYSHKRSVDETNYHKMPHKASVPNLRNSTTRPTRSNTIHNQLSNFQQYNNSSSYATSPIEPTNIRHSQLVPLPQHQQAGPAIKTKPSKVFSVSSHLRRGFESRDNLKREKEHKKKDKEHGVGKLKENNSSGGLRGDLRGDTRGDLRSDSRGGVVNLNAIGGMNDRDMRSGRRADSRNESHDGGFGGIGGPQNGGLPISRGSNASGGAGVNGGWGRAGGKALRLLGLE